MESNDDSLGIITALFAEFRQVEWLTQLKLDRLIEEVGVLLRVLIVIQFATLALFIGILAYEVLHG